MAYTVIRTDLMSGTVQPADLVSLRFYNSDEVAAVENGTIVKLSGYEDGEREVMKAVAASSTDDLSECAIVASPEVMYDDGTHNLNEFTNEAGDIARGYLLRNRNMFSVTKEGFVGGTVPSAVGTAVGIGTGGKINASGTGLGTCVAIENHGAYTYYTIMINKPKSTDSGD